MMGDGKTSYDHDDDGDKNALAACSVSNFLCLIYKFDLKMDLKANFRRTNVATKVKLTYIKDTSLEVRKFLFTIIFVINKRFTHSSKCNIELVSLHFLVWWPVS